jgi:hypothetical protein
VTVANNVTPNIITNTIDPPTKNVADSGSTGHFFPNNTTQLTNILPTTKPISVILPDGSTIRSTHTGLLPIPELPLQATKAHLFPSLHTALVSIPQLCDAGCSALFTAEAATILLDQHPILQGSRTADGLWQLQLNQPPQQQVKHTTPKANAVYTPTKLAELVKYSHATLFSPVFSTLEQALLKGYLTDFPGLTLDNLRKYPPDAALTAKGHLKQHRQGTRSTKASSTKPLPFLDEESETDFPKQLDDGIRTHQVYAAVLDKSPTGSIYTDQTGRFPLPSSSGNQYLFVLYDYDSNYIDAHPIPNRTASTILKAFKLLYNKLVRAGCRPKLYKLDNECSTILKEFLHHEKLDYQLVPPGIHRRNAAERAIQTLKSHFITGLCSTDPAFPLHLWCKLLPQCLITLNLLRGSRLNPKLSAHAQLHGPFDFNAHPMAPPGTHVVAHTKPNNRASWSPPGEDGWYLGPSLEHYRCYIISMWKTKAERIIDTLEWFPKHLAMPTSSSTEILTATLEDLATLLHSKTTIHTLPPQHQTKATTLNQLNELFRPRVESATTLHPLSPNTRDTKQIPASILRVPEPPTAIIRRSNRTTKPIVRFTDSINTASISKTYGLEVFFPTQQANKAINVDTGELAELKELLHSSEGPEWDRASAIEWGRLTDGCTPYLPSGTNAVKFIPYSDIPHDRRGDITYIRLVTADRPFKDETKRVRATAGGDRINYPFEVASKTADLPTSKALFNSVVSTPGAKFMSMDLKDFFLSTPSLHRHEYARIPISSLPAIIVQQYQLDSIAHNGCIYIRIDGGMYGLPQAARLANELLVPRLAAAGFKAATHTHGLFTHPTRHIKFCLIVDDFGVEYVGKEAALFLLNTLQKHYTVTADWSGSQFCGIHLDWDYKARTVNLSMPGYVERALQRFKVQDPPRHHSPHKHLEPQYGAKIQLTTLDTSPPIDKDAIKTVREIVGVFLYYGRAIDNTILVALGSIAAQQSKGTEATAQACVDLLNYAATYPNATIQYHASDMILHCHTDASYLSESEARSRAGGYFYLSNHPTNNKQAPLNGAFHVTSTILRNIMASAAEAEVGAAFHNAQEACALRTLLEELGYPQPATPLVIDNQVAKNIIDGTVKQKRSKAIDMRFYWLRDRVNQNQFILHWRPGIFNLGDYFTKHFNAAHHKNVRPIYLHEPNSKATIADYEDSVNQYSSTKSEHASPTTIHQTI